MNDVCVTRSAPFRHILYTSARLPKKQMTVMHVRSGGSVSEFILLALVYNNHRARAIVVVRAPVATQHLLSCNFQLSSQNSHSRAMKKKRFELVFGSFLSDHEGNRICCISS